MANTVAISTTQANAKIPNYEVFYDPTQDATGVIYEKYENYHIVEKHVLMGKTLHKVWYKFDTLSCYINFYDSGTVKREAFYVNDKLHFDYDVFGHVRKRNPSENEDGYNVDVRDLNDNIAVIHYDEQGNAVQYENWVNGVQKPVLHIETNEEKTTIVKKWYELNGLLHNVDGPAYEEFYQHICDNIHDYNESQHEFEQNAVKQVWKQNGKYYRADGGCTEVLRDIDNLTELRSWYNKNGVLHRDGEPAYVKYRLYEVGVGGLLRARLDKPVSQQYYQNGAKVRG